jgi:hypothetical protein
MPFRGGNPPHMTVQLFTVLSSNDCPHYAAGQESRPNGYEHVRTLAEGKYRGRQACHGNVHRGRRGMEGQGSSPYVVGVFLEKKIRSYQTPIVDCARV